VPVTLISAIRRGPDDSRQGALLRQKCRQPRPPGGCQPERRGEIEKDAFAAVAPAPRRRHRRHPLAPQMDQVAAAISDHRRRAKRPPDKSSDLMLHLRWRPDGKYRRGRARCMTKHRATPSIANPVAHVALTYLEKLQHSPAQHRLNLSRLISPH
jgi:hypothetical protein